MLTLMIKEQGPNAENFDPTSRGSISHLIGSNFVDSDDRAPDIDMERIWMRVQERKAIWDKVGGRNWRKYEN